MFASAIFNWPDLTITGAIAGTMACAIWVLIAALVIGLLCRTLGLMLRQGAQLLIGLGLLLVMPALERLGITAWWNNCWWDAIRQYDDDPDAVVAMCHSDTGGWWGHFRVSRDWLTWIEYTTDGKTKRWAPPPVFRGERRRWTMPDKKVTLHLEIKSWMTDDKDQSVMHEVAVSNTYNAVNLSSVPALQQVLTEGVAAIATKMNALGQAHADAKAAAPAAAK